MMTNNNAGEFVALLQGTAFIEDEPFPLTIVSNPQ